MEKIEAYKVLEQVCVQFRGTLQEHQAIQHALQLLKPVEAQDITEVQNPSE